MDYEYIKFATLKVMKDCDIHSFPINCYSILRHYKLSAHSYSSLSEDLRNYCLNYSDDALNYKDKICYNDKQPYGRINFSLMHELGHVILNHSQNRTLEMEREANFFASNILAPKMVIHYAKCKNQNDVAKLFNITNEAAQYAFDDYRRWHRWALYHKISSFDQAVYSHFYNEELNRFIYSIRPCIYCDSLIYNSDKSICPECSTSNMKYIPKQEYDSNFLIAESHWLYGGL